VATIMREMELRMYGIDRSSGTRVVCDACAARANRSRLAVS